MSRSIYTSNYSFNLIQEMEEHAARALERIEGKSTMLGMLFSDAVGAGIKFNQTLEKVVQHEFSGQEQNDIIRDANARGVTDFQSIFLPAVISHLDTRMTENCRCFVTFCNHAFSVNKRTGSDFQGWREAAASLETLDA